MEDKVMLIRPIGQWSEECREMMEKRGQAPELPILSIPTVNNYFWGIHRKEMLVIGARPSNFKSVLSMQLGWDMAKQGKKVYLMSLEMPVPLIMERLFNSEFLVSNEETKRGATNYNPSVRDQFSKFLSIVKHMPFLISDCIGRDIIDIDFIEKHIPNNIDVLIIDHLNEVSQGTRNYDSIAAYINRIRTYAIRNNIALVVCCQVNRSARQDDDKTPQLHQLKGSGAIEEKADACILLHYPHLYNSDEPDNILQIQFAKNRYGATGHGRVYVYPAYSRISDDGAIFKDQNERMRHA